MTVTKGENHATKVFMSISKAELEEANETSNPIQRAIAEYKNPTFSSTLMFSY